MRTHVITLLSMSFLAAGQAGCPLEPGPSPGEPHPGCPDDDVSGLHTPLDVAAVVPGDLPCGAACGQNTPYVHGLRFDGLKLDGTRSDQGFRILGFTIQGTEADLEVENGEFYARLTHDGSRRSGIYGTIDIEWHVPPEEPRLYKLHISGMHDVQSWAAHDKTVPAYTIIAEDLQCPGAERKSICVTSRDEGTQPVLEDTHAVLLVNERYDVDKSEVSGNEPGWFTIACEGSALYKMRLAGYDPEIPVDVLHYTAPSERQATLKMITADYCGTGHSYTEVGTDVRWQNKHGWCTQDSVCPYYTPRQMESVKREAIWGPKGALCLDTPRFVERDKVACVDREIPYCNDDTMASLGADWETFTPYLLAPAP